MEWSRKSRFVQLIAKYVDYLAMILKNFEKFKKIGPIVSDASESE